MFLLLLNIVLLTICGSFDRLTQPEISFRVSRFTVLILRIKGCFVTISPAIESTHSDTEASTWTKAQHNCIKL